MVTVCRVKTDILVALLFHELGAEERDKRIQKFQADFCTLSSPKKYIVSDVSVLENVANMYNFAS